MSKFYLKCGIFSLSSFDLLSIEIVDFSLAFLGLQRRYLSAPFREIDSLRSILPVHASLSTSPQTVSVENRKEMHFEEHLAIVKPFTVEFRSARDRFQSVPRAI